MNPLFTKILTGRCSNGYESDRGVKQHVVPTNFKFGKALCGKKPGRLSNGFVDSSDNVITCPKCLKAWQKDFQKRNEK